MKRAIFIDKDGTLIRDVPYNTDPDKIVLEPYAGKALQLFRQHGYLLIIVSNQSGIARGYFQEARLHDVKEKINSLLNEYDIQLDAFFYCPHHPEGTVPAYTKTCDCRKPAPGMLYYASVSMNIDLARSWMIGDILHDIEAGNRAGCRSILINNGNETEWILNEQRTPCYYASDWQDAASFIIKETTKIA
jgi:D,D-heptose 1,7-bisphosphate phosphatase